MVWSTTLETGMQFVVLWQCVLNAPLHLHQCILIHFLALILSIPAEGLKLRTACLLHSILDVKDATHSPWTGNFIWRECPPNTVFDSWFCCSGSFEGLPSKTGVSFLSLQAWLQVIRCWQPSCYQLDKWWCTVHTGLTHLTSPHLTGLRATTLLP